MSDFLTKFSKQLKKILNQNIKSCLILFFSLYLSNTIAQNDLNSLLEISHNRNIYKDIKELENKIIDVNYSNYRNLYPTVSLGMGEQVNFGRSFDPISGEVTPRDSWYNNSNFSIRIEQRLTNIFQSKIDKEIYHTNLSIQELTNLENQKKADIEIINNYYDCLLARDNLVLSLNLKDILIATYNGYEELYQFGKIDTLSLISRRRQVLYMDKEIATYLITYLKTQNKLKKLTGINDADELILQSVNIEHFVVNFDIPDSDLAIGKRLMQKKEELNSLTWKKSKNQMFSNVNFYSSFGSYHSSILDYQYTFWDQINLNNFFNVGMKIDLPIYSKEKKNIVKINKLNSTLSINKSKLELQETVAFWNEIKMEYESGISLFYTLSKVKDLSYKESCLNQSKYNHQTIPVTQFVESNVNFINYYREYLFYKMTLLKQRDILQKVLDYK